MYSSLKTTKVAQFKDHFKLPDESDIPNPDFEEHPSKKI